MTVSQAPPAAEAPAPPPRSEHLPWWRKVGYGVGDIFGGGQNIFLSFYYLHFLTSVVRINPGLAGLVILISKGYDAITDPLEGIIMDRTRTRFGRRRPYLVAGVLLVFLAFVALFYPFNMANETVRFTFVLLAYLFFSTVYSLVMLNYNALQSELTLDYHERTSLSSVRMFFSTTSALISAVLPLEIVKRFDDIRAGYITMALIFGVAFALPFIVTVLTARERPEFQRPPQPFHWREAFLTPFKMRTFVFVLLIYLITFVAMDTVSSVVIYYMTYYMGRASEANYVVGALMGTQILVLPLYTWLSRRTSKRTGFMIGASIWMAAMLVSFLVTPDLPGWVVYAFAIFVGTGTGGCIVMIYAMFPDIPDVDELQSGERREAMYFALFTFGRKLGNALALFLVGQALALGGYVAPVETLVDGVTVLTEQPQTAEFITTLRVIFAVAPTVLLGLSLLAALRYPLTGEVHARLRTVLDRRRAGHADEPVQQAEAASLQNLLFGS